jgi:hypothetical protein
MCMFGISPGVEGFERGISRTAGVIPLSVSLKPICVWHVGNT